jgi:SAM-dependent methyltransferase
LSGSNAAAARRGGGHKADYGSFLARNPFESPFTLGFFYREKMRAIHRIAPDEPLAEILEVGAGEGGLTKLLYPLASVTSLDIDPGLAAAPANRQANVRFVASDATALPFASGFFDAVTMFDVLEHVPGDDSAVREAVRVLRPGGLLMVSTPAEDWRFPFHAVLKPVCPPEAEMFAKWGHVRRGYSVADLEALVGWSAERIATFINPVTVVQHDIAFSRLPRILRKGMCTALLPVTLLGYACHRPGTRGTENAVCWRRPAHGARPGRQTPAPRGR